MGNPSTDFFRAMSPLVENSNKNFVRRILQKEKYPTLYLGNGNYATHKMSYATVGNGQAVVYPTVIYDAASNSLKELPGKEAYDYALRTGEHIKMPEPEAAWWSQNYKKVWEPGP